MKPALDARPWRLVDRIGTAGALVLFWGLVAFLALTMLTACDPMAGSHCDNPGSSYNHGNVRLVCGIDHAWHK